MRQPSVRRADLLSRVGTLLSTGSATGATLKELMARFGHSSVRAAMIYQHATRDRDQAIAKALGTFVRDARGPRNATHAAPGRSQRRRPNTANSAHETATLWHVCGCAGAVAQLGCAAVVVAKAS
jgi:hypothetical protein